MPKDTKETKASWRECFVSPHPFVGFGKAIRHIVCFDENGSSSETKYIRATLAKGKTVDENRRYFTLTGCLFDRDEFSLTDFLLRRLKEQHWREGSSDVLFHSHDIRKKIGKFNLPDKKYKNFIDSLSSALSLVPCMVFSITFDLLKYVQEDYQYDPYEVAFDFLLERIIAHLRNSQPETDPRVALVFETRGTKEDKKLLGHAAKLLYSSGTKWAKKIQLQKWVRGVFFNSKSTMKDGLNLYPGIEIADLFSYPIHRYARYGHTGKDFEIVKQKLYGHPRSSKKGFNLFPKSFRNAKK